MGLLGTRWEATHQGHTFAVVRSEITRGFSLSCDGHELARRTWSWIGLGELHGTAELDGKPVDVHVALRWGGLSALDGKCAITVDGHEIAAALVG